MPMRRKFAKAGRAAVGPFLALALIAYFGLNLVQGDHGLLAWARAAHKVHAAQATLALAEAEKNRLEHRASLLKGDHLDRDMLDERARAALNVIGPNEIVVFTGPENN
jgi:cell division protein FtsB